MKSFTHSELIAAAAREVLRPLGLKQKGRSRTWLDDHGWWVGVVEFQPSGWSKGTYLNAGTCWLWNEKDYISFDVDHRVEPFVGFQDEEQFRKESLRLAQRATNEVVRYREMFPNVRKVSEYYLKEDPTDFWPSYHAGIACGLAGRYREARRFFRRVVSAADSSEPDWVIAAANEAHGLASLSRDRERFREVIGAVIARTRHIQSLPPLATLEFDSEVCVTV